MQKNNFNSFVLNIEIIQIQIGVWNFLNTWHLKIIENISLVKIKKNKFFNVIILF